MHIKALNLLETLDIALNMQGRRVGRSPEQLWRGSRLVTWPGQVRSPGVVCGVCSGVGVCVVVLWCYVIQLKPLHTISFTQYRHLMILVHKG